MFKNMFEKAISDQCAIVPRCGAFSVHLFLSLVELDMPNERKMQTTKLLSKAKKYFVQRSGILEG